MSLSRNTKNYRKKSAADVNRRVGFEMTHFGRQRTRTKAAVIGALLLAICAPVIYLYHRVRRA